jgi:energy-coupling factor transporter transmembrane protein EcfT
MAVIDVSFITYFGPLLAFLIVFILLFVVFNRTKIIGENDWVQSLLAFIIAAVFVSVAGAKDFILTATPWIAVLIISLVFIILMLTFVNVKIEGGVSKGIGAVAILLALAIFTVSAFFLFSHTITQYLPGNTTGGGSTDVHNFLDWLYSARVGGAILLVIAGGIVSWILVKSK